MTKKIIGIPPFYFLLSIIFIVLSFFFIPKLNIITYPLNIITGVLFLLFSLYFIGNSYIILKKNNTSVKYQKSSIVVTNGIYRYSRNPMYVGFVLFIIGISFSTGNLLSFIFVIIFFLIINYMFIPFEEEKMEQELGKSYMEYKNKVRRWL